MEETTKEVEVERICANCKSYVQHYGRYGGRLKSFSTGHCLYTHNTKFKSDDACKRWLDGSDIKEERIRSLKAELIKLSSRLNTIATMLSDDFC